MLGSSFELKAMRQRRRRKRDSDIERERQRHGPNRFAFRRLLKDKMGLFRSSNVKRAAQLAF